MSNPTHNIHQAVIDRALQGNGQAYHELYRLYSKAMFNVAFRMVGHWEMAEDVLQEAFMRAFDKLGTYKGTSTFGAWLKRIVVNEAISQLKKGPQALSLESMAHDPGESPNYEGDALEYEVGRVKKAMEKLADGYRVVLNLYLLEGYDHREIAEILDITESTSKTQYNRAKKKLRNILEEATV